MSTGTGPLSPDAQGSSTRPYLLRALHDWCTDNGFTPYIAVHVDGSVRVPMEYVKNDEIVLNIGFEATSGLKLGNEFIEFKARFGGSAREIVVPVDHVVAIYARENGQGMAFPVPTERGSAGPGGPGAVGLAGDDADARQGSPSSAGAVRAPTPLRGGLRLASAPAGHAGGAAGEPAGDAADPDEAGGAAGAGDGEEPPPEGGTPGSRPSLKRIK